VYDPNSNRPVKPSSPNCPSYIPGNCKGRNWWVSKSMHIYLERWWRLVFKV
jgi:hypothetical protein